MSLSTDGGRLFLCSALGARTRRLLEVDTTSTAVRVLAEHERYDVGGTRVPPDRLSAPYLADPATGRPQVAAINGQRLEYQVLDPACATDLERLGDAHSGDLFVLSRDAADRFWTVGYLRDVEPVSHHLYDRATGEIRFLFRRTDRLPRSSWPGWSPSSSSPATAWSYTGTSPSRPGEAAWRSRRWRACTAGPGPGTTGASTR
ncbi:MAG TPA: hypothetical protein VKK19_16775 [Candidatus Dormibacteraeota bacterium]|nr:hypothetical protein [Candidatus Dormibacteraeota bacterium]